MKKNRFLAISAVFFLSGCSSLGGITRIYNTPKEVYPPAGTSYTIDVLRENDSFYKIGNATQTPFLSYGWYRSIPTLVTDWDVIGVDDTELGAGHDTGAISFQITFVALNTLFSYDGGTGTYQLINDLTGNDIFDAASAVATDTPNLYSPSNEYVYMVEVSNRSLETIGVFVYTNITSGNRIGYYKTMDYPAAGSGYNLDIDNNVYYSGVAQYSSSKLNPYENMVNGIPYISTGNYVSGTSPITITFTRLGVTLDGLYADMYDDFYDEGYSIAENEIQAIPNQIESVWDILSSGVNVVNDLLSVEVLPNVPISLFIAIPMVLALLFWFIDELRNR